MSLTATTVGKPGNTNISRQVLRGALLGFVLAPTLLVWVAIGSSFFGYRVADAWGTSMEPTLHNGDALWVKQLDIADVKVGDIVTIVPPVGDIGDYLPLGEAAITHRVVKVEPLSNGSYFLETKGDSNDFIEEWEISNDWIVALVLARVPFAGYVVDFLASIFGTVLVSSVLVALFVIWVHRRRMTRRSGRSTGDV